MSVLNTKTSVGQEVISISTIGGKSKGSRKRKNQKAAEEWNKKLETKIRTSARLRDKLDKKRIAEDEAAEAELAAQIAKATPSKNKKRKAKRKRRQSREAEAEEQSDEEEILLQPTKKAKRK